MLSVLRNACSPLSITRRTLAACYSTEFNGNNLLRNVLADTGVQQEKERTKLNAYNQAMPGRSGKFKAFQPGRPLTLKKLTYKYATNAPKPYKTKRPAIGPSPSVARPDDLFHQFDIDPVKLVTNARILSGYVSEMGKIYGRNVTGLTYKSQRRIGKAIRRAKMMGIIPVLSRKGKGID